MQVPPSIQIENLSVHYAAQVALQGASLAVAPGELMALVGPSGCGTSSLLSAVNRMSDLVPGARVSGRVLIDGRDVLSAAEDVQALRRQIGMVQQDSSLLHRSLRENIAYGRPDATDAEIWQAAKEAEALEFIDTLQDPEGRRGMSAHVGERGVKLSGGQRQRITLARVILKNAPILLLDEATSALDSEVEAAIQDTLYGMMRGKTVIAIAHRLSTIAQMDRIVVLDKGLILEEGTHKELLARGGVYADLWARQSGGFLADGAEEEAAE